MDIKQVNSAIMFGTWTDTELASMIDAIKFARAGLRKQVKNQLSLGSTVKWTSPKNPHGNQGTVERIATKFVNVRTPAGLLWKVPAEMLEVI